MIFLALFKQSRKLFWKRVHACFEDLILKKQHTTDLKSLENTLEKNTFNNLEVVN